MEVGCGLRGHGFGGALALLAWDTQEIPRARNNIHMLSCCRAGSATAFEVVALLRFIEGMC